jgi:hypothetical protein
MTVVAQDPYSDAFIAFSEPAPAPGESTASKDAASLLTFSVPADNTEVELGAQASGTGDRGVRITTDNHAHIAVTGASAPETSISLGASPTENLGGGIQSAGLSIFTAGSANVTTGQRTELINGTWDQTITGDNKWVTVGDWNGCIWGFTEDMVMGEHLDVHCGDHTDLHLVDHIDVQAAIHWDTHLGMHQEIHLGWHSDVSIGTVKKAFFADKEEVSVGEQIKAAITEVNTTISSVETKLTSTQDEVTHMHTAVNAIRNLTLELKNSSLKMDSHAIAVHKAVLRIYQ